MIRSFVLGALAGSALIGINATSRPTQQSQCAARGPTPLRTAVTAAERNAVPLATSGVAFISVASSGKVIILDLRTGERTTLDAGINGPHEVAVSPDGG